MSELRSARSAERTRSWPKLGALLASGAAIIASTVITGGIFVALDVARRFDAHRAPIARHVGASMALYALVGAVIGIAAAVTVSLETWIIRSIARRWPRIAFLARTAFWTAGAVAICWPTSRWLFEGAKYRYGPSPKWAPYALTAGYAIGAAMMVAGTAWIARRLQAGRPRAPVAATLVALSGAAVLSHLDLTRLVALYSRLHTLVEIATAAILATTVAVWLVHAALRRTLARATLSAVAALALTWAVAFLLLAGPKSWLDESLRHVWLEPHYVGRMLARLRAIEDYVENPNHPRDIALSGAERICDEFDIADTAMDPRWDWPPPLPAGFRSQIAGVRSHATVKNIIVFYVDTLRFDVARDPSVMPSLSRLAREGLVFTRAYSAGSDTVRSLPTLTSGRFGGLPAAGQRTPSRTQNDFVEIARRGGLDTTLVIPSSANEFLEREMPAFEFDRRTEVADYSPLRTDVWGYGADQPSAAAVVDRALEWLRQPRSQPFLLWLFQYDQHNWREIDDARVSAYAQKFGLEEGRGMARYRLVARSIDHELGRFVDGIDALGLRDETLVLFVSDHGEAVGRDDFWVHSIFLWEALVRVPLVMRIPGVSPGTIDEPVSLVDVAPTIARFLDPDRTMAGYHGEDLIGYLMPNRPPRRLPMLMASGSSDRLLRIGLVDPRAPWKLVLGFESGAPELYDVSVADPDWENLSEMYGSRMRAMLSELVRSPLFPRSNGAAGGTSVDFRARAP